ncbi:hypothetical protein E4199_17525 [Vibrio cholerae]|nr:hypothetical protein [Vibrio cholerae]EGR1836422.1 hypothetical protein [Vibrio cholerae]
MATREPLQGVFFSFSEKLKRCFPNTSLKCGAHLIKLALSVNCFFSKLNRMMAFWAKTQIIDHFSCLSHSQPYTFTGNLYVP